MELGFLKGIGPRRIQLLQQMGIESAEDLLCHFPRRYEDRTKLLNIAQLIPGEVNTLKAEITSVETQAIRRNLTLLKAVLRDSTGFAVATWFNQPFLQQKLHPGQWILLTGKVQIRFGNREILVQDYEMLTETAGEDLGRIVPVYPSVQGLNQNMFRMAIAQILESGLEIHEYLPEDFCQRHRLMGRQEALRSIHCPVSWEMLDQARRRLIFDEFFLLQLALGRMRSAAQQKQGIRHLGLEALTSDWLAGLPFRLTQAQNRVIEQVRTDMAAPHSMRRLIQGDVGSGKTVVAAWALLRAVETGHQSAMMAPTEILAKQHYDTLSSWFEPLGVRVALLKGSTPSAKKAEILEGLKAGTIQVAVGTHALFQETVVFKNLSLLVIDEQHRFGVRQRAMLEDKGITPDMLVMSATPIPRTLALTVYGDLDLSSLDEMPPGRKPVQTLCILDRARPKLNALLEREIGQGFQVYVVCPLIEETETADLQNAKQLFADLAAALPQVRIGLLHGRMAAADKEAVMAAFERGELQLLVSTTVIEVGVNVPKATVMVVENAERFGLAQLHQLRGRVGRGGDQSYCILVTKTTEPIPLKRLKLMTETNDGFRLAEEDMLLRGPGEFFGTRQHGLPEFRIAQLPADRRLLEEARGAALDLLQSDPNLQKPEHLSLNRLISQKVADMVKT